MNKELEGELDLALERLMCTGDHKSTAELMQHRREAKTREREYELRKSYEMHRMIIDPGHSHGMGGASSGGTLRKRPSLRAKLAMRMGWDEEANSTVFSHIHLHQLPTKVLVLVVTKDNEHTLIEDDGILFPSDTLVTQLRLMGGE